jgi:hypothetical protein
MMLTRNVDHRRRTTPEVITNRTDKTQDVAQLVGTIPESELMTTVYERLKNLQITLPGVPPPVVDGYVAAFVPFVRSGNVIYVSGRVVKKERQAMDRLAGANFTIEEGKQAALDIAIDLIATLQAAVGDLNKITRIGKLVVLVKQYTAFYGACPSPITRDRRFSSAISSRRDATVRPPGPSATWAVGIPLEMPSNEPAGRLPRPATVACLVQPALDQATCRS